MNNAISIITAVYNGATTISDCLKSVSSQTYPCEHIIIDGGSTDGTLSVVGSFPHVARVISEPDNGIYDAMNKGIALASGDIIGILNADDIYIDEYVMAKVAEAFNLLSIDALFADLVFVRPGNMGRIVRFYSGADFTPDKFAKGWMPPHPTFFVRKECYKKYGLFKTDYKIAADFEMLARLLVKHGISYYYLPEVIVKMRTGGLSTRSLKSNWILNREILRACAENGIRTNLVKVYAKYFRKVRQLFERPK